MATPLTKFTAAALADSGSIEVSKTETIVGEPTFAAVGIGNNDSDSLVANVSGRGRGRATITVHELGSSRKKHNYTIKLDPDVVRTVGVNLHAGAAAGAGELSLTENPNLVAASYRPDLDTATSVQVEIDINGTLEAGARVTWNDQLGTESTIVASTSGRGHLSGSAETK
jgi:hypothetical protein